jgi:hypothetical protein
MVESWYDVIVSQSPVAVWTKATGEALNRTSGDAIMQCDGPSR